MAKAVKKSGYAAVLRKDLAAIRRALPKGTTFCDWYGYPVESAFVGSPRIKREARSAWDRLQGAGDALGLTVGELLDAEDIDWFEG